MGSAVAVGGHLQSLGCGGAMDFHLCISYHSLTLTQLCRPAYREKEITPCAYFICDLRIKQCIVILHI